MDVMTVVCCSLIIPTSTERLGALYPSILTTMNVPWTGGIPIVTVVKKTFPQLYFLSRLRNFDENISILTNLYRWELADRLHHSLVWQLFCPRPQITTESGGISTTHHWQQTPRHISSTGRAESTQHLWELRPPSSKTVLLVTVWRMLRLHTALDWRTVVNTKLSDFWTHNFIRLLSYIYVHQPWLLLLYQDWYFVQYPCIHFSLYSYSQSSNFRYLFSSVFLQHTSLFCWPCADIDN